MSFNIDNFGSDASNVKSILGGVCYYRYYNKDNNTVTNPGYFPASLGLQLGDRITVIPSTKTDADEEYIVSDITNRVVTVTKVEAGLDTSKVVNADVLPTASADNLGYFYLYTGATDASHTHGYIYECVATPVYDATVEFNPASLSSTTAACSGSDFAALVAQWGTGAIDTIIKGTLTYDESGELLVFVGQDDTNTTVCTFQLYVQDYVDAGFTFTGTFQDGDVIAFTCTIEETGATYAWVRQDVQPQPAKELPTQAGNSGKYLKTNGVSASWAAVESLPDQTGQSGKFLTTDGTDASWSDTPFVQKDPNKRGVCISSYIQSFTTQSNSNNIAVIGNASYSSINLGKESIAIAGFVDNTGTPTNVWGVLIGSYGRATGKGSVALGSGALATADGAIQISSRCQSTSGVSAATNSDANTFKVANANGNFEMMNANGNLPADRLASTTGLADGNYRLRLTISGGVPTLSWVAE